MEQTYYLYNPYEGLPKDYFLPRDTKVKKDETRNKIDRQNTICVGKFGKTLCYECKLWHPYDMGTILPGAKPPKLDSEFKCEKFILDETRKQRNKMFLLQ